MTLLKKPRTSGLALLIAILIVVVLVIAGGTGYYFYLSRNEVLRDEASQKQIDETVDLPSKDLSTEDWKVYENKIYGFILKLPEPWADFEVKESRWDQSVDPGMMPPYYDTIDFFTIAPPRDIGGKYDFSVQIQAYSHDSWAVRRLNHQIENSAALPRYPYLGENKNYVFSWRPMEYISHPGMSQEEFDKAEDTIQLRRQEAESIISTFKVINPLGKTAEWERFANPGKCKDIEMSLEKDYMSECYLESFKTLTEIKTCKEARPDYRDFCYFQVAQNLKDSSICKNLSVLINQESCYQKVAVSLKNASICKNISTEQWRNMCYMNISETLKDPSICEEIKNPKAKGYCLRGANPPRPEIPIAPISEWKTYVNEKHKYSFQYPPKWDFKVDLANEFGELFVIRERISNEPEWPVEHEWLWNVVIETWDNPQNLSLKDWLSVIKGVPADAPRITNASVGEEKIEALQVWQGGVGTTWDKPGSRCFNDCPNLNVYFVYKGKGYRAALVYNRDDVDQKESQEIFNQILSTFKFIE